MFITVLVGLAVLNALPGEFGPDQISGAPGAAESPEFQREMADL